ncbi:peptide/nickel transport system permease protein [Austwickia chelonae]|uniref:Oligopeptide transport system permease protein OppC n=1 Tax=Austwickia chelonae NBRC 105200 TaxID=1184607 RepID=K6VJ63_9MICO|nr:ABC transporter permease [Austwickia chelonae]GAB76774.1 putative ABC transporter permease protein [Austwickia chelonae NBRC 105200]SEW30506.1 peptide/nickel transport system permease protein [Austwickia chelonae]
MNEQRDPTRPGPVAEPLAEGEVLPSTPLTAEASSARIDAAPLGMPARVQTETAPSLNADSPAATEITSKSRLIVRRLLRNKGSVIGLGMLTVAVAFTLLGNLGNEYGYDQQDLLNIGTPPGEGGHILGTNGGGVDLWAMLVRGTGKSLMIAAIVGVCAPILGAAYGTAIAFWGGTRERVGMWVLDMLLLMPYFLLIAVFMGNTGGSAVHLALFLTMFGWMGLARVVRATTQSLREREFVTSARYLGVSDWQIIRRHIIPNIGSYLILNIVLGTFGAIISETALSFLGIGVRAPDVSLGQLIGQAASQLSAYPWLFWGPVVCLLWLTLSLSLIGDGLRDALDPNSKSGGRA